MTGYGTRRPLTDRDLRSIPVYSLGRGLQMTAKRVAAGQFRDLSLAQVDWLVAHQDDLITRLG